MLRRVGRQISAEAAARIRATRLRELEAAQAGMRNFQAGLACSGGPLPVVPEDGRLELVLAPSRKRRREPREWQMGRVPDKRGRWAVDYIIRIRGLEPEENGWEALVEWRGPFSPSWVRKKDLCGPAKAEARAMAAELYEVPRETWPEFEQFFSKPDTPPSPPAHTRRRSARLALRDSPSSGGSVGPSCFVGRTSVDDALVVQASGGKGTLDRAEDGRVGPAEEVVRRKRAKDM